MNFSLMKAKANELCRTSRPSLLAMGGIYYLLITIVNALSSRLVSSGFTQSRAEQYMTAYFNGDLERCIAIAARSMPSGSAVGIDTALQIVMRIVAIGFVIFVLNTLRNQSPSLGNLLDGFGIAGRVIVLNILEGLFVFLWSLLFFVPGIIAAYRYRMAKYLMIDHPEKSVWQCLQESKRMMKGHKWELFRLDLSLLGWHLLGAFIPLAAIWTMPYIETICAQYYDALSEMQSGPDFFYI